MRMENKIIIELPEDVYSRLEHCINSTVEKALNKHIDKLHATSPKLSRVEAATMLRVSLMTLRRMEKRGELIPHRAGKRIFYVKDEIDKFLSSSRTGT